MKYTAFLETMLYVTADVSPVKAERFPWYIIEINVPPLALVLWPILCLLAASFALHDLERIL